MTDEIDSRFQHDGRALFVRCARLLGTSEAGARAAEVLFVRLMVHARLRPDDAAARHRWIVRAATNYCIHLRVAGSNGEFRDWPPAMTAAGLDATKLGALDEATANVVVLAAVDRASADEIADTLALPTSQVSKRLGSLAEQTARARTSEHPSRLALAENRLLHAQHLDTCEACRLDVEEDDRLGATFEREIIVGSLPRVTRAIRAERARLARRPRWMRALWLGGATLGVAALALLVARPHTPTRDEVPYAGIKGASRARAAGIEIRVRHDDEVRALAPGDVVGPGDRLHFRVRGERPRYLELRARAAGSDVRIFPVKGEESVKVVPGQPLTTDFIVPPLPAERAAAQPIRQRIWQPIWIVGLFADAPFRLDRPAAATTETVAIRVDTGR